MPEMDTEPLEDRLVSQTETYLDRTEACIGCLPHLLAEYPDHACREIVDRISTLESDCDRSNRRICALVADADVQDLGIKLTRVHLHAGQTIELFHVLDDVANAAEQFADDLATFQPDLSPVRRDALQEMAQCALSAMAALRAAVSEYVAVLCDPGASASIADDVQRVRETESECDRIGNEAVRAAFDDGANHEALVYRELVASLDDVVNAMEDVTDRVVRTTGSELSIDAEPEVPRTE